MSGQGRPRGGRCRHLSRDWTIPRRAHRRESTAANYGGPGPGDSQDRDPDGLDVDESFLLAALAQAFPAWAISYSFTTGTWTARTRKQTIRHHSAVLLCAAMVLTERRYRQSSAG